mgnify:CR=1 FL=1
MVLELISDVIDKVLLGVTTLEPEVDPVAGCLKERTLLLYKLNGPAGIRTRDHPRS